MRILVLSSAFSPHVYGGGEVAAYNLTRLLARRGHEVSVATLLEADAEPCWGERMPEGYRLYRLPVPRTHTFYGRTAATSVAHKLVWHAQDYADPRNRPLIERLLADVDPQHVDIHNIAGIGYNVLPLLQRCSAIYFLHDLGLACFSGSMFRAGSNCCRQCGRCRLTGALRQRCLDRVPRLGFVSPSQANLERLAPHVAALGCRPTAVIRNVPDELPTLPDSQPSPAPRLLYAGRLDVIKGIAFLLEVLASLAPQYPFHLTVLGTGNLEASVRQRFGACPWVTFKGFVPRTDVAAAMARSDVFCMPSLWSETYGIVTAQALQVGTPVIGSNIGGTAELVRHEETGLLIEPGNFAEWQAAFQRIFGAPDVLKAWRGNALRLSGEFSPERIGEDYETFLAAL
jgi:glycosyltransferase involved in cell wall biosynthesis